MLLLGIIFINTVIQAVLFLEQELKKPEQSQQAEYYPLITRLPGFEEKQRNLNNHPPLI